MDVSVCPDAVINQEVSYDDGLLECYILYFSRKVSEKLNTSIFKVRDCSPRRERQKNDRYIPNYTASHCRKS